MTAQTSTPVTAFPDDEPVAPDRGPRRFRPTRATAGLVLIVVWGLAPFYWMIVTAFREVGFTFDTVGRFDPHA